jgi:predicted transcriptional regulator
MRPNVSISDVVAAVEGEMIFEGESSTVQWVVSSGLMSDILTTEEEEILLLSNLNTTQLVRTADMVGANAMMVTSGKPIPDDTVELAKELGITLIRTKYPVFEACHKLSRLFFKE